MWSSADQTHTKCHPCPKTTSQRVPLALKDQFKQELDNMVSQGILSKLDDANVNAPEWLNSFVVVKKPNGKL